MKHILDHIRSLVNPPAGGSEAGDAHLLGRFVATGDQEAFAALVRRHGGMVLGVCRRVLHDGHDAEDAFQAVFFVLARRASSLARREALASWLYGVARRTALEARRRRARERPMDHLPHPEVAPAELEDWRPLLDEELDRLPEKYRAAIVLADLEGRSRKEVARLLRVPEGTVSSRLAAARRLLAGRLSRRGVVLPGGVLGAALAAERASAAAVSATLAAATARAALRFVAGESAALASPAAALTTGVFRAMLMTKLKVVVASVMVATVLGACGLGACYTASAQARPAAEGKDDLEALRKENDLLRRSLELALDKVRAQDAELKDLRIRVLRPDAERILDLATFRLDLLKRRHLSGINEFNVEVTDPAADIEAALKGLREAKDKDDKKRAAEALEKALKKLKEQIK